MSDPYLWLKFVHILAIISWMAGLLYLPRLFVYHVDAEIGSRQSETFKVMERRLMKAITTPAMIVSVITGLWLGFMAGWWSSGWLHAKTLLVVLLLASHVYLARVVKIFARDANTRPGRWYRIINEVPTVLMIGIVFFVVMKPFG
ncbi:protoporphyrinogen oxidase HemJ [Saliniramus sp.]|uniref:protoporphyrinogen oxidase HemJ n=1 Tax=Saliniramus sp. TaxID=2986772 RepID=UPI002B53AA5B|nr:protoporphyrinogen oxidase HemJ [Saliniramus sp.]HMB12238.1 protoporphyrinogen oxidase HemJ [Saliniramus sp.]